MITIVRNGVLATLVMVLFFDLTNFLFRHGLDFSYINGTSTGLDPESFFTRLIGYVIVFGGGIFFAWVYEKMIKKKTIFSAILYSLLFVLSICGGLIVLPIIGLINPLVHSGQLPNPGLFGLGFGLKAAVFTTIGHIIFGTVLGYFSQYKPLTHIRKHPKAI